MLGNLLTGFVVILLGVTLAPTVANTTYGVTNGNGTNGSVANPNQSAASIALLQLVPLFFNLGVAIVGIDLAVVGLKRAGLIAY